MRRVTTSSGIASRSLFGARFLFAAMPHMDAGGRAGINRFPGGTGLPPDVPGDLGHHGGRVQPEGAGEADQFHHVEPALPGLDLGDPGGVAVQLGGEVLLAEVGLLPGLDEEGDEPPVGGGVDGLLGSD